MKKGLKIGLLGLAAGGAAAGSVAAISNSIYQQVMLPTPRDPAREESDHPIQQEGRAWARKGAGFRSATLQSVDGLTLWAAHVPAAEETHRWVICVHGFKEDHTSLGALGMRYHREGWNVLLPDQRGYGHSEGRYIGWGFDERLDLIRWISWIIRRDDKAEILLHGVSMGAATVLMATGGPLPKNVRAAVSDCSYTSIEAEMRHVAEHHPNGGRTLPFPSGVMFSTLRRIVLKKAGFDLRDASPVDAVGRSDTPTLFIHGSEDDLVPPDMMGKLVRAAKCPKSFLWVPGAPHADSAYLAPDLYWATVDTFVHTYFA